MSAAARELWDRSPLESPYAMKQAKWRCMLCPTDGIGGLEGWGVHYMNTHYLPPERDLGAR